MNRKLVVLFLVLFILTGCGNKKKLVCEKKEKNAGYDYFEQYELVYEKDNIKVINLKMEASFNEFYTDEEIDEQKSQIEDDCHMYELVSLGKIECFVNRDGQVLNFVQNIDVENIDDVLFEKLFYLTKDDVSNYDDIKEVLSNTGYSCK